MRILFLMMLSINIFSCKPQSTQIGIINDIHFLSEELMDDGEAINKYIQSSGRSLKDIPQVLDQVIANYTNSNIEILLIPGDITKDGEKQSHLDFVAKMKPLTDKGVRVFVIPGNHDINMPNSLGYKGATTYPVSNISPEDFATIYANFGYNSAFSRDSSSLSYTVALDSNTWLLAIDGCLYNEYKNISISAGKISPATEQWALNILQDAKKQNIQVIGMMHHGLVEHFMLQEKLFPQYIINDWQRVASLFADNGLQIVFTGHFHANDITKFTSDAGNSIYDVETGALAAFPFAYRFAELSDKEINITTRNITSTPSNNRLAQESKEILQKLVSRLAKNKIKNMEAKLPESVVPVVEQLAANLFIQHVSGDEIMTEQLKKTIDSIIEQLDIPLTIPASLLQLDFSPADNDVKILFDK